MKGREKLFVAPKLFGARLGDVAGRRTGTAMKSEPSTTGFPIVLTAGKSYMANYRYNIGTGYASMLPVNLYPLFAFRDIFQLDSDQTGRMHMAQLGLCKVEAALVANGFSRDDVIIANPEQLDRVVGPSTKVIGIGVLDPLGLAFGARVAEFTLRQFNLPCQRSKMSADFLHLIRQPIIKKHQATNSLQVVVGGPGVWQIADSGVQKDLRIDCIIEGEAEVVVSDLFRGAIAGERLPPRVQAKPLETQEVPHIITPSRCGVVEITRGCGRGCKFCVPALLKFRSFPQDRIMSEIRLNQAAGIEEVSLQSDDFMRYGSKGLKPEREPLLQLLYAVREVAENRFGVSFASVASIMQDEQLLEDSAEAIGLGGSRYSTIEMGIETGSPRLLAQHMAGKVKPFKINEWPDLVESAAQALHDCNWICCHSLIIGLPGETTDDIMKTMELVDRIKGLNCVITPVVFVPAGRLRQSGVFTYEQMSPEQWALFLQCIQQTLNNLILWVGRIRHPILKPFIDTIASRIFKFSASYIGLRWRKKLQKLGWSPSRRRLQTVPA
jgi:radical SAM superfamily enzyme YgiQ (UPF0313 family)